MDFESGRLKNFGKSDMERGRSFGFFDIERFVSIGEDYVLEGLFGVDETFSVYLRVRNFRIQVPFLWLRIVGCLWSMFGMHLWLV